MDCENGTALSRATELTNLKYYKLSKIIAFVEVMSKAVGLMGLTMIMVFYGVVLRTLVSEKHAIDDGGLFVLLFYAGSCIAVLLFIVLLLIGAIALHRATNVNLRLPVSTRINYIKFYLICSALLFTVLIMGIAGCVASGVPYPIILILLVPTATRIPSVIIWMYMKEMSKINEKREENVAFLDNASDKPNITAT